MNPTLEQGESSGRPQDDGLRFARRMHRLRTLGLALGAVCVGGALWDQGAHALAWAVLLLNALAWPHIAYPLARRSGNPYRAELRNLMMDSASGGAWMAVIGFSPPPTAVIFAMMAMDKVSVGGLRFLARCLAAQAAAAALVAMAPGFELHPLSSTVERLATLPLLVTYPIVIGLTTYRLARRVRSQNQTLAALSSIDGLSGLLNRSHWEAVVAAEFQRCRRIGHLSSVVMIDIDHFKSINDRYGHPVGDAVIRSVAGVLRSALRLHDVPGRYGGENSASSSREPASRAPKCSRRGSASASNPRRWRPRKACTRRRAWVSPPSSPGTRTTWTGSRAPTALFTGRRKPAATAPRATRRLEHPRRHRGER